jgi:hypothetical protein
VVGSLGQGVALFECLGLFDDLATGDATQVGAGGGREVGLRGEVSGEVGGDFAEGVEDDGGFLEAYRRGPGRRLAGRC